MSARKPTRCRTIASGDATPTSKAPLQPTQPAVTVLESGAPEILAKERKLCLQSLFCEYDAVPDLVKDVTGS